MPSGVRDIQLLELKDTISQLNNTISTQNELIRSLQKMLYLAATIGNRLEARVQPVGSERRNGAH